MRKKSIRMYIKENYSKDEINRAKMEVSDQVPLSSNTICGKIVSQIHIAMEMEEISTKDLKKDIIGELLKL